ncbi:hypothetical protein OIU76_030322 [Salix suchowensis]|nr:hypothetical protein OIU76_030322 [Salix suchowensis]
MEVVGGAVLSALLEPLVGKLSSGELMKFARKKDVEEELKKWTSRFKFKSESGVNTSTALRLIPTCFAGLKPRVVICDVKKRSKLQKITVKLDEIVKEKNNLCLRINAGGRLLFQQSSMNKSKYVMHALIADLARSVSQEICFNLDDSWKGGFIHEQTKLGSAKIRHSAFSCHRYDISKRFEVYNEMKSLRTFLALPISSSPENYFYHLSDLKLTWMQ